jgi:hypothetical protein
MPSGASLAVTGRCADRPIHQAEIALTSPAKAT